LDLIFDMLMDGIGYKHFYIQVEKDEWKYETLCDLYSTLCITQSIIYTQDVTTTVWLTNKLNDADFTAVARHPDMTTQELDEVLFHLFPTHVLASHCHTWVPLPSNVYT
jgi:superfamily II DNA/RNA helicase